MAHPEGSIFQVLLSACEQLGWGPALVLRLLPGSTKQHAHAQSMTRPRLQDAVVTLPKGHPQPSQSHSKGWEPTVKDQLTKKIMGTGWGYSQKCLPEAAGSEVEEEQL